MAAKLLRSLADDNSDLQTQIGCTTGMFQLFDRPQVVSGRRPNPRRHPSGNPHFNDSGLEKRSDHSQHQRIGSEVNRSASEIQKDSRESSRFSCSSSCSSSLSSVDFSKTFQPGAPSSNRVFIPETHSKGRVMKQGSSSSYLGQEFPDLQDVVKDSMHREARGLFSKTASRDEALVRSSKHQGSPRPVRASKSVDGFQGVGISSKSKTPADMKESLRVLAKLRETHWFDEPKELPESSNEAKNVSLLSSSDDAPRFSYDERDRNRLSFESGDTIKSMSKPKEMPRLSVDSKEHSMRSSNLESEPDYYMKNVQNGSVRSVDELPTLPQLSSNEKRPTSLVAKLMGLDTLPDAVPDCGTRSNLVKSSLLEHEVMLSKPSSTKELNRPNSPRNSMKDPVSPRRKNDLVMRPISNSKFPFEPAPWKQPDGSCYSQKPTPRPVRIPTAVATSFPSVYSEIDKRLKDIEFDQSGRDLRALKQIIGTMQAKSFLETGKEETSNFNSHKNLEEKYTAPTRESRLVSQRDISTSHISSTTMRSADSSRMSGSPIVIIKPAKRAGKSGIPTPSANPIDDISGLHNFQGYENVDYRGVSASNRTSKVRSPKVHSGESALSSTDKRSSSRNIKSTQTSTKSQYLGKERASNLAKSLGSGSPILQQKKIELEKRSRPPIHPLTDPSKPRRQSNRHPTGSGSPVRKMQTKSPDQQLSDDQFSEMSYDNEARTFSYQGDASSLASESSCFLDLRTDIDITSMGHYAESDGSRSPSVKAFSRSVIELMHKKLTERLSDDGSSAELGTVGPEHPSPISVLDKFVHNDHMATPVKQIADVLKDEGILHTNIRDREDQWNSENGFSTADVVCSLPGEINSKKSQNIEELVQKLRRLNSTHDEASTDYIASLSENTDPDHRYISEILLASGLLLRDLGSGLTTIQLHPSGLPLNPELFLVLERTKSSTIFVKDEISPEQNSSHSSSKLEVEKCHRKLIFDAVNEILAEKLDTVGPSVDPWLKPEKLAKKSLSGQKLLKELCLEIEKLQTKSSASLDPEQDFIKGILREDVMQQTGSWTEFNGNIPGIVLDIERLIFKDLVDEIVIDGANGLRAKQRRRRQLFGK